MKHQEALLFLCALTLSACTALAQTSDVLATNHPPANLTAARCQYTPAEESCRATSPQESSSSLNAQLPQRTPGPPYPPRPPMRGTRYGSPAMWASDGNAGHTAVGALIGFGLGAALGASVNNRGYTRSGEVLVGGALGAVFGAALGHAIPSFHSHHSRRPTWNDDSDEDAAVVHRNKPQQIPQPR